jgi:hypothetical protein
MGLKPGLSDQMKGRDWRLFEKRVLRRIFGHNEE